ERLIVGCRGCQGRPSRWRTTAEAPAIGIRHSQATAKPSDRSPYQSPGGGAYRDGKLANVPGRRVMSTLVWTPSIAQACFRSAEAWAFELTRGDGIDVR